jgi:hypothetical protein
LSFSAQSTAMNHLVNALDLNRIENSLLSRRAELAEASSFAFNMLLLALVLAGFAFFLYTQYHSTAQEQDEVKRIPFTPTTWYSATRNVRNEEYGGQPFEAEARYGLP